MKTSRPLGTVSNLSANPYRTAAPDPNDPRDDRVFQEKLRRQMERDRRGVEVLPFLEADRDDIARDLEEDDFPIEWTCTRIPYREIFWNVEELDSRIKFLRNKVKSSRP